MPNSVAGVIAGQERRNKPYKINVCDQNFANDVKTNGIPRWSRKQSFKMALFY